MRPRNWNEYGKKVKTDRRDALALVSCLDRYVAGNTKALANSRVPTEAEEQSAASAASPSKCWSTRKPLAVAAGQCR